MTPLASPGTLETLLRRYPRLGLEAAEVRYRPNFALRGLLELPVALGS